MNKNKEDYDELEQYDFSDGEFLEKVIDKYSPLLGLFLINFSEVENELNGAIADYINERGHETGFVIIEKITTSNKIDLFYKLYLRFTLYKPPIYKAELTKIKKQLNELNLFRNALVHANWDSLSKDGYVRTRIVVDDQEGSVMFRKIEVSLKTIRNKIKEAGKLIDALFELKEDAFQNP